MQRRTLLSQVAAVGVLASLGVHQSQTNAATRADLSVRLKDGQHQVLSFENLHGLVQYDLTTSTPWYDNETTFRGPLMRDVLALANFNSDTILATAVNDYRVEIPMQDVLEHDVVLAHTINAQRLTIRTRGPLFVIYPFDQVAGLRLSTYYSRCIWQLTHIEEQ